MKLIKTTLVVLTIIIGFSSNAQDSRERKTASSTDVKARISSNPMSFISTEQIANKRVDELNAKVELNEEQLTKVKELFLKVENRKKALNNSNSSEEEKNNTLNELQKMEDEGLQSILTTDQKKILSAPKTNKTATDM